MNQVKLLDCTLRDGGYYNDWDFSEKCAKDLLSALDKTGVDIVELGYKSPTYDKYYGLFKYCPESELSYVKQFKNLKFAFMIDVKEFMNKEGKLEFSLLEKNILPQENSLFQWVRVASHFENYPIASEAIEWLHKKGYKTCYNMMGLSLLSETQVVECLNKLEKSPVDVFYFADSFGSMEPADIRRIVGLIRKNFSRKIGIHTHDNKGLAFANSLAAAECGVDYIDGTVMGMGRGAGNVRLEQLLLSLYFKDERKDLNVYPLLDVIQTHMKPMHETHGWGWDFSYMLSGLLNIHPSYCQKLRKLHHYTMTQVAEILTGIPQESRVKFQSSALENASRELFQPEVSAKGSNTIPDFQTQSADSVLIIGAGASVKQHHAALKTFIQKTAPMIIECNYSGLFDDTTRHMAILNEARFKEISSSKLPSGVKSCIIPRRQVAEPSFSETLRYLPCKIKQNELKIDSTSEIVLPGYVVGMYATSIALLSKPKRIFLAGFDGLSGSNRADEHEEMNAFWNKCIEMFKEHTEIISILPTHYELPSRSVYSLI